VVGLGALAGLWFQMGRVSKLEEAVKRQQAVSSEREAEFAAREQELARQVAASEKARQATEGKAQEQLAAAGVSVTHVGYPEHAPGGELRAIDPDGHVVMIAQTTGAAPVDPSSQLDTRTSVLQAAEVLRRRGTPKRRCEIGAPHGRTCPLPAAVKLADTWGDSAWSCLDHADEVLLSASGAYLATEDGQGLTRFLARRRATRS
jgi:hypothetical protein